MSHTLVFWLVISAVLLRADRVWPVLLSAVVGWCFGEVLRGLGDYCGWVSGCCFRVAVVFRLVFLEWFRSTWDVYLVFAIIGYFAVFITTWYRMSLFLRFLLTGLVFFVIICASREMVVLSSASVLRL